MYHTRATQPLRARLRVTKQLQPLPKKQPLHIQNMNVPSSAMHINGMMNKNGVSEYLNYIPLLVRIHPMGISPVK